MDRKTNRLLLLVVACSATGVVLGGASNWAETHQCWQAETPSAECLTQDPLMKTIQGMGSGLLGGAGAALGATWQLKQKRKKQED